MSSNTQQTKTIRRRHRKSAGKARKRLARLTGTPTFPIHPEGYDPTAADARPAKAAGSSTAES